MTALTRKIRRLLSPSAHRLPAPAAPGQRQGVAAVCNFNSGVSVPRGRSRWKQQGVAAVCKPNGKVVGIVLVLAPLLLTSPLSTPQELLQQTSDPTSQPTDQPAAQFREQATTQITAASTSQTTTPAAAQPAPSATLHQLLSDRPQPLPVAQAFPYYLTELNQHQLRIIWHPAPDHYLYRHAFNFRLHDDPPDQSSIRFTLPPGQPTTDQFFGPVEVYAQPLSIHLQLPPTAPGKTLILEYRGCTTWGFCYPPQRDELVLGR